MPNKGQIRVLVVDDSVMVRNILRSLLEEGNQIKVVGEAEDGVQAVAMTKELKPDLVTMDIVMPVMGGLDAISEIMAATAVPILVVSSQSDAKLAFEAVSRGALDVIAKPDVNQGAALRDKVMLLNGVKVITHIRKSPKAAQKTPPLLTQMDDSHRLVFAIASSTGGPGALTALLGDLPQHFPHPVVVAQHIADGFAQGLAELLDSKSPLSVRLAKDGDILEPGCVYISPSDTNLVVQRSGMLRLLEHEKKQFFRPSCDVLLSSVAESFGSRAVGIILTGMGRDGVCGMERIVKAGGATLAQDEASSVVFGMNNEAIKSGCVQKVLSPIQLAAEMCDLAASASRAVV